MGILLSLICCKTAYWASIRQNASLTKFSQHLMKSYLHWRRWDIFQKMRNQSVSQSK